MNDQRPPIQYQDLVLYCGGPPAKPGAMTTPSMMASFRLSVNISALFPYINAVASKAELHGNPALIRFVFERRHCVLYPDHGFAAPFYERPETVRYIDRLMVFVSDIDQRKAEIVPKSRHFRRTSVVEILKLLPKTNCRQCGYPSCLAFAASVSQQETVPARCPYTAPPIAERTVYPVYDEKGDLQSEVVIDVDTSRFPEPRGLAIASAGKNGCCEANQSLPQPLSRREIDVLRILARDRTNTQIARELGISAQTVKSHMVHIFNKLGVNDRTQAAIWAVSSGLVECRILPG